MKISYLTYTLPLKKLITQMGRAGLPIYTPNRLSIKSRLESEAQRLQSAIDTAVGYHVNVGSSTVNHLLFNDLLLERPKTYTKKDTADNETILTLDSVYDLEILRAIPELRTKLKIISTYLDDTKFIPQGNNRELFTCQYKVSTKTQRLASAASHDGKGGNYQNIPKKQGKYVRNMVAAPPGYVLIAADLAKAELWTTGIAANSSTLLNLLKQDVDVHAYNGQAIYNALGSTLQQKIDRLSAERDQNMARVLGKHLAHGWDYGEGIKTTIKTGQNILGIKLAFQQAKAAREGYFKNVPELPDWHSNIQLKLYTQGYLKNKYGFRIHCHNHLPKYGSAKRDLALFFTYYAWEPQSTVGIYTNHILLKCHNLGLRAGIEMRAQIHDELLFMVKESDLHETVHKIQEAGSSPIPGTDIIIPLDFAAGYEWGALEEFKCI